MVRVRLQRLLRSGSLRGPALALAVALVATPAIAAPSDAIAGRPTSTANARRLADARPAVELKGQQEKTDQALAARERAATKARSAAKARDGAAATVARLKQQGQRGPVLEAALQQALSRDEAAARARSAVAAADAVVAKEGARLLRLYDAVLADRRRAVDAAPAARRKDVVDAYRALVAQRDAVRQALAPVLAPQSFGDDEDGALVQGLDVGSDDDVEALLEKADLARDLEARLLRKADAVRRRMAELRDEASLEGDVAASVARGQLFDEEDRRLVVTRDLGAARPGVSPASTGAGNGADDARTPEAASPTLGTPTEQSSDAPRGTDLVLSTPVTPPTSATGTAERPLSLPTELATSTTTNSLSELQALDAQLQKELTALRKKQAALKKAAADRSR